MPELIPAEPGTPAWLAARRAGVTATDIVTILGLSHWDSVYSLFWRKMQQAPEVEDNDRFRLGRELESYIADRWSEGNGGKAVVPGALYRHNERSWQMATLDRLVYAELPKRLTVPLELKSWADGDRHSWGAGIYTGRVGDDGERLDPPPPLPAELTIPAQVRAQVLWQMDVMDVSTGHVGVVFLPSGEFRSYTIEHEPTWVSGWGCNGDTCLVCSDQKLMIDAGLEFMARLRLELPPPDPDASMATLAAVRARFTRQPDKQAEVNARVLIDWGDAKEQAARWDRVARGYEIELREQAQEASVLTVDGQPVARRVIVDAQVKAHTRHQDYLRRIEPKGDDSAD
jgi:hypothetical protein